MFPPADVLANVGPNDALVWLRSPTTNDLAPYVEDFASIKAAELEGAAQHSADELAGYSGQVDSVSLIDPDTASVRYTLLNAGNMVYSSLPGTVVRINGQWMVSRETVCGLLAMGNVQCPPRAK